MKFRICEIEKSGRFEIQELIERRFTLFGLKPKTFWRRSSFGGIFWNGHLVTNIWKSPEQAKAWLRVYQNWSEREPVIINLD
jgi:hypothetical protein